MKSHKGKVLKLIYGIDNKVWGAELVVYSKNSEKTYKMTFTVNCTTCVRFVRKYQTEQKSLCRTCQ